MEVEDLTVSSPKNRNPEQILNRLQPHARPGRVVRERFLSRCRSHLTPQGGIIWNRLSNSCSSSSGSCWISHNCRSNSYNVCSCSSSSSSIRNSSHHHNIISCKTVPSIYKFRCPTTTSYDHLELLCTCTCCCN